MSDEYFGVNAEFSKDNPETLASTLRVIADTLENAPENRRYDATLEILEYEYIVEPEHEDYEDMNYNDLKTLASKRGLEMGAHPNKQALITVLDNYE